MNLIQDMPTDTPDPVCTWESGNEPCDECPRRITALHMCGILKDELNNERIDREHKEESDHMWDRHRIDIDRMRED
jgi:hypothetical protein